MSEAQVRPTDKGRALFEGSDDPTENPVRFRKCTVCEGRIDIMRDGGIEWTPGEDSFAHRACLATVTAAPVNSPAQRRAA